MNNNSGYTILRNLLKETSAFTGEAFIKSAVHALAKELRAEFVFITQVLENKGHSVKVLAAWQDGHEIAGWEFALPGTPCELIYKSELGQPWDGMRMGSAVTIADHVHDLFEPVKNTSYQSFIGIPLWNDKKKMIGHMALFFNQDMNDQDQRNFIVELVELFSYKVQAELNRMLLEQAREKLVAELKAANECLVQETITDSLTHLYNRRYFNQRMQQAFARLKRSGAHYALMLVDLDYLKTLNDLQGHHIGDAALIKVAETLLNSTRNDVEIVFRIGGDEFAILLLEMITVEELASLGKRINTAIHEQSVSNKSNIIPLSVSIGAALSTDQDDSWKDIYIRADKALYEAKHGGRNQTAVSGQAVRLENAV